MPRNDSRNSRQPQRFSAYRSYGRGLALNETVAAQNRHMKTALVYAGVTALCLVFCAIYEVFSFGEHSLYMRMMFMMPLLGGAVPFGLMAASQNPPYISRGAFNLWNSGLAVRVSGCLWCAASSKYPAECRITTIITGLSAAYCSPLPLSIRLSHGEGTELLSGAEGSVKVGGRR